MGMKDVAIYGAGGFGRETACLLREINEVSPTWNFIGFFDDGIPAGTQVGQGKVLGGMEALNAWGQDLAVVFAIATPKLLEALYKKISNPLISFPNIVAPTARLMDRATLKIGKGNVINWTCSVSCDVEIGDFNLFNGNVTIGHDTVIGNFNSFMTGTRIAGRCKIGDKNFFGSNSSVFQGIRIGENTTIGSNSFLTHPAKNDATYVGIPAIRMKF